MKKRVIGIVLSIILMALVCFLPAPEGLSQEGWYLVGVLFSAVVMWITECWPKKVTTLYIIAAVTIMGIYGSIGAALQQFMSQPVLMVFGSFFLAAMFDGTDVPLRLVCLLTKVTKDSGRAFLFIIMLVVALAASVLADFASTMIFCAFICKVFNVEAGVITEDNKQLKKALFIALPTSALCGSLMLPIGGPINLVVMGMLEGAAGISMTFAQWLALMFPISIGCLVILWFWICVMIKPGKIEPEQYRYFTEEAAKLGKWRRNEKLAVVVLAIMIGLWFSGTWIDLFASGMVVCIGTLLMYIPGIDLVTEESFKKEASWDMLFFLAGLMIIATAVSNTHLIDWTVTTFFSWLSGVNPVLLVFLAATLVVILRVVVPAGPPVTALCVPALMTIGMAAGVSPTTMMAVGTTFGAMVFFLPVDVLKALTYQYGQFTMKELIKVDGPAVVTMIVFVSLFAPFMVGVLGL